MSEQSTSGMEHYGRQSHPDGDRCDLEYCQGCGLAFTTTELGHFVDSVDVGKDAEGGTAQVFRQEADRLGREWLGFEEDDVGPWCDSCSDRLQRKRSAKLVTDGGTDSTVSDRELRTCSEYGSGFVFEGPNVDTPVSGCPHCGEQLDSEGYHV